jgi:TolB-like protein/DNA-binding CsgD family transcriptional regulator/Flp pilus assembly protein TadD
MRKPSKSGSLTSPAALGLSERQAEVLALMMQGKSNKAICRVLNLAEPTVKYHVATILRALKVANRTEAVLAVGKLGWTLPQVAEIGPDHGGKTADAPVDTEASEPVAPALPEKPSIVVLPFANLSGDPSQDYFTDGMVEDITIALGRLPWLFVIGSASAFAYKHRAVDLRQIGAELGVHYVLMGSVRKEANRVRIAVQLTDTARGGQVWADRFEGELEGIFAMQDRVASQVSATIAPALRSEEIERARRKPTENLTAYDLFLRALPAHQSTYAQSQAAIRLLHKAIELDPAYSSAYGLAGWCYYQQKIFGWIPPNDPQLEDGIRLAKQAAERGKNDSEGLWMAALTVAFLAGELELGLALIEKSLSLNPNSANAWWVRGVLHEFHGDIEIALEDLARARRLNPLDPMARSHWIAIAIAHFLAGRYEEANAAADRSLNELPNFPPALRLKIAISGLLGRLEEGREYVQRLLAVNPDVTVSALRIYYEPLLLRHNPRGLENYLEGLRACGLPRGQSP